MITLPREEAPNWFVSEILVFTEIAIGILDDDPSVHDAWQQRLFTVSENLSINYFNTIQSFSEWYVLQSSPVQIFSDYEILGESETGLDLIKKYC